MVFNTISYVFGDIVGKSIPAIAFQSRFLLARGSDLHLTNKSAWLIICLTRQPEGRYALPVPEYKFQAIEIAVHFSQEQDGYFFLSLLASVMTAHSIITKVNKSLYVTIIPPLPKDSERVESRPTGCLGKYIILSANQKRIVREKVGCSFRSYPGMSL